MIYCNRRIPTTPNDVDIYVEYDSCAVILIQGSEEKQNDLIYINSEKDVDRLIAVLTKVKAKAFPSPDNSSTPPKDNQ